MLDKNGIPIDLRSGTQVRIRRSWRTPMAGRPCVVSAVEPNDRYGTYLIEFKGGLQFRYDRQDLELLLAPRSFPERLVHALLRFGRSLRV